MPRPRSLLLLHSTSAKVMRIVGNNKSKGKVLSFVILYLVIMVENDNLRQKEALKDRFNQAYLYLRNKGLVKSQKDLANAMMSSESNISKALKGDSKVLTSRFLTRFNQTFNFIFSESWLMVGEGEMLRQGNTASADNSPNAIVNAGNHVSIVGNTTNQYGDSPADARNWSPVVPQNIISLQDTDVFEYMQTHGDSGVERFYSGTANIDFWIQMQDRSLEPYIMQGDFLGLKAYPRSVYNIFQGDVYAIDTRFDGMKVRVIKNGDTPDTLLACSYNKQDYPDQLIRKEDIIRVYKKVLMFRY